METKYILHTNGSIFDTTTTSKDYFIKVIQNARRYGFQPYITPCFKSIWGEIVYDSDESDNLVISGYHIHVSVWHPSQIKKLMEIYPRA